MNESDDRVQITLEVALEDGGALSDVSLPVATVFMLEADRPGTVGASSTRAVSTDFQIGTLGVVPDLTLPARATSAFNMVRLTLRQDRFAEGTETIKITATAIGTSFAPATFTLFIEDDDVPVITVKPLTSVQFVSPTEPPNVIELTDITEGAVAQFQVTPSLHLARPLEVEVEVMDSGMFLAEPAPFTVTVPAGRRGLLLELPTENDAIDEPDGTVTVEVLSGFGYTVSGTETMITVNVADNDMYDQTVVFGATDYMATEGGAAAMVTVSLSPAPTSTLNIPITLGNPEDDTAETADWSVVGLQGEPGAYTLAFAGGEDQQDLHRDCCERYH